MEFVRQQNAQELDNAGEEQTRFCGEDIRCFSVGDAEGIFEGIDGTLDGGAPAVDGYEVFGITRQTGIEAQILVGINVDTFAVFGVRAGVFADTATRNTAGGQM